MARFKTLALGCDLGGSEIKVVALREDRLASRIRLPTPRGARAGDVIALIEKAAREAAAPSLGVLRLPAITLGVAVPGFLDRRRARPVHLSNLPALDGAPLSSSLSRRTGWPVVLEADSNAGALGEARLGAGRGARRLLYLTLGTGVGAAMIVEGSIVRVSHHTVGQVAHLPLDPRGPPCPCGARGCLESVLGARGIVFRAARAARRGADLPPEARRSPADLCAAALAGSRDARRVFWEVGSLLGAALALLSNFLSPDRIVVGGGIAGAGKLLLDPAERVLFRRVHPRLRAGLTLRRGRLAPFAGALGAALLGREARGFAI